MPQSELRRLTIEAIRYHSSVLYDVTVDDLAGPDGDVARRVGWRLVERGRGFAFFRGRDILKQACGGMLMPPPNARYWTGPTRREQSHAPFLTTWTVILDHGGDEGPRWEITGGDLVYPEGYRERRTLGLLHVDRHGEYARTTMGWIKLGRRHYS